MILKNCVGHTKGMGSTKECPNLDGLQALPKDKGAQRHKSATQCEYYLNIPFDEDGGKEMRKWVEGWI